jgi:hypothetical protein
MDGKPEGCSRVAKDEILTGRDIENITMLVEFVHLMCRWIGAVGLMRIRRS